MWCPLLSMWWTYNTGNHYRFAPLRSPEQRQIRTGRVHTSGRPHPSAPLPREQPAASGQQPPNCWGEGVLPYLIALDDVIDLPQVVATTCFLADLQQHQAYFLLSQFSRSDSTLPSSLKNTDRGTEKRKGGGVEGNTEREKNHIVWQTERRRVVTLYSHNLSLRNLSLFLII